MAVRLVNAALGVAIKYPTEPIQFGLKSTTAKIVKEQVRVEFGSSAICGPNLAENLGSISRYAGRYELQSPEKLVPEGLTVAPVGSGSSLTFVKGVGAGDNDLSIAALTAPLLDSSRSVQLTAKLVKASWSSFNPSWSNLTNLKAPYVALEYGPGNTAIYLHLRDDGADGSLVLGGPVSSLGSARQNQMEVAFPWKLISNGTVIELVVFFNFYGRPAPYPEPYVPVIEVYYRTNPASALTLLAQEPVHDFGTFTPDKAWGNRRGGPSDTVSAFLGNAGRNGDTVVFNDFQLDTSRFILFDGRDKSEVISSFLPDCPVRIEGTGLPPNDPQFFGRWDSEGSPQVYKLPSVGRFAESKFLRFSGMDSDKFLKEEPRLATGASGFWVEGYLRVPDGTPDGEGLGVGFQVDDGDKVYSICAVQGRDRSVWGLRKNNNHADDLATGYYTGPGDFSLRVPHFVQLFVGKSPYRVQLYIDYILVLDLYGTLDLPDSALSGTGRVSFGKVHEVGGAVALDIHTFQYSTRMKAWTREQGSGTASSIFTYTIGAGSTLTDTDYVEITKPTFGGGLPAYMSRAVDFSQESGGVIDFELQVPRYANSLGQEFAPNTLVGAGVRIRNGSRRFDLTVFDAGVHGKRIGFVPVNESDLLEVTPFGKMLSVACDFTQSHKYRIVCSAGYGLALFVDDLIERPAIIIPWSMVESIFPSDNDAPVVQIGHYRSSTSSEMKLAYARVYEPSGYEVYLSPVLPSPLPAIFCDGTFSMLVEGIET